MIFFFHPQTEDTSKLRLIPLKRSAADPAAIKQGSLKQPKSSHSTKKTTDANPSNFACEKSGERKAAPVADTIPLPIVTFAFDGGGTEESVLQTSNIVKPISEAGLYDKLPAIRVQEFSDGEDFVDSAAPLSKSSESIPFIDESPRRRRQASPDVVAAVTNYHDARFITINAQNSASNFSKENRSPVKDTTISSNNEVAAKRLDKSAHVLYQSQLELPLAHHFEVVVGGLEVKLCQVCHEFLMVPSTVRCLTCGFVCHEGCVATKVSGQKIISIF